MLMVTTRSGRNLSFTFMHSTPGLENGDNGELLNESRGQRRDEIDLAAWTLQRRVTECHLFENDIPLTIGMALCHPNDSFSKATGRKISLHNALMAASDPTPAPDEAPIVVLTREDREDVWVAYRTSLIPVALQSQVA